MSRVNTLIASFLTAIALPPARAGKIDDLLLRKRSVADVRWTRSLPRPPQLPWDRFTPGDGTPASGPLDPAGPIFGKDDLPVTERPLLNAFLDARPVHIYRPAWSKCKDLLIPPTEVAVAQLLNWDGLGPKLIGTTTYIVRARSNLRIDNVVYDRTIGTAYTLNLVFHENTADFLGFKPASPPKGVLITPVMVDDVNRTFDTLDRHAIVAQLVNFVLTPTGRAVAMDFTACIFMKSSAEAKRYNDLARAAYVDGLNGVLGQRE